MSDKITQFGFAWKAANVSRLYEHKGEVTIEVKTPRDRLLLRITPSGLIREWRPTK